MMKKIVAALAMAAAVQSAQAVRTQPKHVALGQELQASWKWEVSR